MSCEAVQRAISAAADGEPVDLDRAHVAGCAACTEFEHGVRSLRRVLRIEVLDRPPDVVPAVLDRIAHDGRPRRWPLAPAAAAFVAGVVASAAFVWPAGDRTDVAVASVPARVVAAQHDVASLAATITVVDADGTRTGVLRYRAPETLQLRLGDETLDVRDGTWRVTGAAPRTATNVEPFSPDAPVPLDLVLPVGAFVDAGAPESLGERTIDGRTALGVRVTAAQVAALLDGLAAGRVGDRVHPTDPVDLWLDSDHLVPLEVSVRAADGLDRARWAAARSRRERGGDIVLTAHFTDVAVNDARDVDALGPVATDGATDVGFRLGAGNGPAPDWLPSGMRPWRTGAVGDVTVQTWTDGRAWIKVRSTTSWTGDRLFGDVGLAVRPVDVAGGVVYAAEGGRAVALHGDGIDVVVTGSVRARDLLRVVASLDVTGIEVPPSWDEAATATLDELATTGPLLVLPDDTGFAAPAGRVDGATTTLVFVGPGDRALVLATRAGDALTPPLDPDAAGVVVRGTAARWSPARGELEWVEDGRLWSLRTRTISLTELVALAELLVSRS